MDPRLTVDMELGLETRTDDVSHLVVYLPKFHGFGGFGIWISHVVCHTLTPTHEV